MKCKLTLHITYENTHDLAEYEVLKQRWNEGERHAEESQQQISNRQIQQQNVRQSTHAPILSQRQNDQRISGHGQDEDDGVEGDPQLSVEDALRPSRSHSSSDGYTVHF